MRKLTTVLGLAIALLAIPSCSNAQQESKSKSDAIAKDVSVSEFKKLVEANPEGQIIDVRTPGEHAEGYVAGAKLMDINGSDFKKKLETLDKNAPVYVFCRSGGRSGRAMGMMKSMGFKEVYNMEGGMMAWNSAGYPTQK